MDEAINPPGRWVQIRLNRWDHKTYGQEYFFAVYGIIFAWPEDGYVWQANTLLETRTSDLAPPRGISKTLKEAKAEVERHLRETNTCKFVEEIRHG